MIYSHACFVVFIGHLRSVSYVLKSVHRLDEAWSVVAQNKFSIDIQQAIYFDLSYLTI